jgi:hypothetical protein
MMYIACFIMKVHVHWLLPDHSFHIAAGKYASPLQSVNFDTNQCLASYLYLNISVNWTFFSSYHYMYNIINLDYNWAWNSALLEKEMILSKMERLTRTKHWRFWRMALQRFLSPIFCHFQIISKVKNHQFLLVNFLRLKICQPFISPI